MPSRPVHGTAALCILLAAIAVGPRLDARQPSVQSVQYRSPEGVEYRSLPETDAVKSARAALEADPTNVSRIIDLGVAQSGAFARGHDATVARRQVHRVLLSSDLSRTERALVLIEVARALLRPADTRPDTPKVG